MRKLYEAEAVSPVTLKLVVALVAICVNALQLAPEQLSIRYPVTATLSVDAAQLSPICVLDEAVACRLPGAVGAVVSPPGSGVELFDEALQPEIVISKVARGKKQTAITHSFSNGRIRTAVLQRLSSRFTGGRAGNRHLFGHLKLARKCTRLRPNLRQGGKFGRAGSGSKK
jgi:hypothetical protein